MGTGGAPSQRKKQRDAYARMFPSLPLEYGAEETDRHHDRCRYPGRHLLNSNLAVIAGTEYPGTPSISGILPAGDQFTQCNAFRTTDQRGSVIPGIFPSTQ